MLMLAAFLIWLLITYIYFLWDRIGDRVRDALFYGLLAAAGVLLAASPFLSGSVTSDVILLIGGPYAYRVETIQRSLTALAVGIALAVLILAGLVRWGHLIPLKGPVGSALKLSLAVIFFRIWVEKLGLSAQLVLLIGIIWLVPPFGAYFGVLAACKDRLGSLWKWLLGYTYAIRGFVCLVMLLATRLELGTHFDNSAITAYTVFGVEEQVAAHSFEQYFNLILFPQLALWPVVTLLIGGLFGLIAYWFTKGNLRRKRNH